jgi:PAS domain S-box-containing protein
MGSESPAPTAPDPTVRARPVRAWSLGWLLFAFALAMFAPVLGFGVFATSRVIVAERADGEEQLRRTARMVSAAIDRELTEYIERLQALTASSELREGDLAGFHRHARAALLGTGKGIVLVDRDLNQLVNTRVTYGTPLPQIHDPDTARTVFATGKPAIGDLVMSRVARRPVVNLVVPVTIDGGARYVLVLSPDLGMLRRILEQHYLPEGWVAGVSDGNGRILARSARHQELVGTPISARTKATSSGRSGVIKTTSLEGAVVLHAFLWSDVSGWRTAVWVPLAILEAPARQLWLALAALAALALTLSLVAAALVGRWLARPIIGTASAAAALGQGDPVGYTPCTIAEVNVVGKALAIAAEQRRQAEADAAQLAAIVESSDDAIIGTSLDGRITSWNAGAERMFGYTASEMIGQPILRILPPELHEEEEQILSRLKRGERLDHYETTRLTKDARRIDVSLTVSPVHDKAGKVIGASKVGRDITERKRAEEHVRLLMRELSHRTKNVMAVVHAISWQTARQSPDPKDFEERFTQRLDALGRSHDLLLKRDWQGVLLEDLVRAQIEPFLDSAQECLAAHGPPLLLMPLATQNLGMALHELATNALKYGALSVPTGKIEIGWSVEDGTADGKRFLMTWRESGGPLVSPPARTGFGSTVTTQTLSGTLKGKAEVEYRAEGLFWQLSAPMGDLIADAAER